MSEHQYSRALVSMDLGYDVDARTLALNIESALPGKTFKISAHAESVLISFDADLDTTDAETLDGVVELHKSVTILTEAKTTKKNAVDLRTAELVVSGFQHNGRVFSSSEVAQKNVSELHKAKDFITYPFLMATKDNSEIYAIVDAAEVSLLYMTALSTIIARYQSGNALKQAIINAESMEELAAIVDSR